MKRCLSFFLVVALLFCFQPVTAHAAEENTISAGQTVTSDLAAGETRIWKFSPSESGAYTVTPANAPDGVVFSVAEGIASPDFILTDNSAAQFYAQSGHTYLVALQNNSGAVCTSVSLSLTKGGIAQSATLQAFDMLDFTEYGTSREVKAIVGEKYLALLVLTDPMVSAIGRVTSSNTDVVEIKQVIASQGIGIILLDFKAKGEETITVDLGCGVSASYKFVIWEPTPFGVEYSSGIFSDAYARNGFIFTAPEDGLYRFQTDGGTTHLKIEGVSLPDENGQTLPGYTVESNMLEYECRAGETYLITVSNLSNTQSPVNGVMLGKPSPILSLDIGYAVPYVGYETFIPLNVTPHIYIEEEITWTTSDPSILKITEAYTDGCYVEALKVGTVTLTATTASGVTTSAMITTEEYIADIDVTGTVTLGDKNPVNINNADDYAVYQFNPSESAYYIVGHDSKEQVLVAVFNGLLEVIDAYVHSNDICGIPYWMDAGKTYYIISRYNDTTVKGKYNLSVGKLPTTNTGWVAYKTGWYYFQDEYLYAGWLQHGSKTYFLHTTTGAMVTGWWVIDDIQYYFDSNGIMQTGLVTVDGVTYCFDADGALGNGWVQLSNTWYHTDIEGKPHKGWQYIDGNYYYFGSDYTMKTGWLLDGGNWYYLNSNGTMATGWVCVGSKWYYMNSKGIMQTGWVSDGGQWYYLDSGGIMQTGWLQQGSKWYYMNSKGIMQTGWVNVSGKWYYMNSKGIMQTGWLQQGSKWYYLQPSGVMATGPLNIDGTMYLFDANGIMATGWAQHNGKWYYAKSNGILQTGWLGQGSNWYYINSKGVMQTGWVQDNGKWYYMNSKGIMQTGWVQDGGNRYYMGSNGVMRTGWYEIGGNWYYFQNNGIMAIGSRTIDGKIYLFNADGVMQTGWIDYNGHRYYAKSNGVIQTGWVGVGKNWYYMNAGGQMQIGWIGIGTKWYYMDSDGVMVTGTKMIDGTTYKFDDNGVWIG